MDPFIGGALIGGGMSLLTSAGNFISNWFNNKRIESRQDNAVQRRADDLEAAGINRILAAGSAAESGGEQPGQIEDPAEKALSLSQAVAQVNNLQSQARYTGEMANGLELDNDFKRLTLGARVRGAQLGEMYRGQLTEESRARMQSVLSNMSEQQWTYAKKVFSGLPSGMSPAQIRGLIMNDPGLSFLQKLDLTIDDLITRITNIFGAFK